MPEFSLFDVLDDGSHATDLKCTSCPLATNSELQTNCMKGSGGEPATVMFVNTNPTMSDDESGKPFQSSTGKLFKRLLEEVDFPKSVYFTNAVKCSPRGQEAKDTYWKKCRGHLRLEIERVKPKVIVALGVKTFRWVSGFGGGGKFKRRGFPCAVAKNVTVVPFDHPQDLQEADPEDYGVLKAKFVKDLFWLKTAVIEGIDYRDSVETDYRRAKTIDDVRGFLEEFPEGSLVYCDLETRDPNHEGALFPYPENRIAAIGFSARPGHARMIPYDCRGVARLTYWDDEELAQIKELLATFWRTRVFVGHNFVQFDQKWISVEWGFEEGERLNIDCEPQLMSHSLDEEPGCHGLEDLALRYTKMTPWKHTFTVSDVLRMCDYLAKDLDAGMRLLPILKEKLNPKQQWLHDELQLPLAQESREWEQKGVRIDVGNLELAGQYLEVAISESEKRIRELEEVRAFEFKNGPLNLDSPQQIGDLLENYYYLEQIKETGTGQYCADASVLQFWEDKVEFCGLVLKRRRASKLKSTYVDGILERVRKYGDTIHYSIDWSGTVTGRPSGSNPNVFNIPRADTAKKSGIEDPKLIKNIFRAREGCVLLQADYSQAELRVLASFSKDESLIRAYLDDVDVHTATAASLYNVPIDKVTKAQRSDAKAISFGIVYGKSERGIQQAFVDAAREKEKEACKRENRKFNFTPSMEREASLAGERALAAHKKAYPGVWRYLREQERIAKTQRYIETEFGRRRRFKRVDNRAIRQAYNYRIQSVGSGDITHTAIVRACRVLREAGYKTRPVLTVYDSIVFEVPNEELEEVAPIIKRVMENLNFDWLLVPMKVDLEVGTHWGDLEDYEIAT